MCVCVRVCACVCVCMRACVLGRSNGGRSAAPPAWMHPCSHGWRLESRPACPPCAAHPTRSPADSPAPPCRTRRPRSLNPMRCGPLPAAARRRDPAVPAVAANRQGRPRRIQAAGPSAEPEGAVVTSPRVTPPRACLNLTTAAQRGRGGQLWSAPRCVQRRISSPWRGRVAAFGSPPPVTLPRLRAASVMPSANFRSHVGCKSFIFPDECSRLGLGVCDGARAAPRPGRLDMITAGLGWLRGACTLRPSALVTDNVLVFAWSSRNSMQLCALRKAFLVPGAPSHPACCREGHPQARRHQIVAAQVTSRCWRHRISASYIEIGRLTAPYELNLGTPEPPTTRRALVPALRHSVLPIKLKSIHTR